MNKLLLIFALTLATSLGASVDSELRLADDARIAAPPAGEADQLAPLLSAELSYGHADGRVQTKAEFLNATHSGRVVYRRYDYRDRVFTQLDENVATMSGRAELAVRVGEKDIAFRLRFLAIWKREEGAWRLFAYQSAKLPAPTLK